MKKPHLSTFVGICTRHKCDLEPKIDVIKPWPAWLNYENKTTMVCRLCISEAKAKVQLEKSRAVRRGPKRIAAIIALGAAMVAINSNAKAFPLEGVASWYGGRHHGGPTASGERYNQDADTCAMRSPVRLGTVVRVTNLRNGRSTTCRVNDRGPFIAGRVIDLSRSGARAIGIIDAGTAKVRIDLAR